MIRKLTLILVLALLGLAGCDRESTPAGGKSGADSTAVPDSDLRSARIYLYDKGRVTTEIFADTIIKFDKRDSTVAYGLDIDIFDSLGQVSAVVVGDSGIIRETQRLLSIFSHVVVRTADSIKLETEFLFWNSQANKIQAPENVFVKFTQGNDVMTGYGLEATQTLSSIKILKQVSGTLHKTERFQEP
jgi:LPS export ABC transporter protein LptC